MVQTMNRRAHQVDGGSSTNASGKLSFLQVASDSAHRELQTCFAGSAD